MSLLDTFTGGNDAPEYHAPKLDQQSQDFLNNSIQRSNNTSATDLYNKYQANTGQAKGLLSTPGMLQSGEAALGGTGSYSQAIQDRAQNSFSQQVGQAQEEMRQSAFMDKYKMASRVADYQNSLTNFQRQIDAQKQAADLARESARAGVISSVLGAAGSFAGTYMGAKAGAKAGAGGK